MDERENISPFKEEKLVFILIDSLKGMVRRLIERNLNAKTLTFLFIF